MYNHPRMHCRWYRVKFACFFISEPFFLFKFMDTSISLILTWSEVRARPFVFYENHQKAACTNKLWLVPQNVNGPDIWFFWQIKLVVRAFKNTQNLKIVKMWVSPLVHDAIQFLIAVVLVLLNRLFLFFIHMKLELLTQIPVWNDKNTSIHHKWSSAKCNYLINWASITNYFVDTIGILFVYILFQQQNGKFWVDASPVYVTLAQH